MPGQGTTGKRIRRGLRKESANVFSREKKDEHSASTNQWKQFLLSWRTSIKRASGQTGKRRASPRRGVSILKRRRKKKGVPDNY